VPGEHNIMRVDFNDDLAGIPASDRATRAVVLAVRDAIEHIKSLGWLREDVDVLQPNDQSDWLVRLNLRGRQVFEVRRGSIDGDQLLLTCTWAPEVRRPTPFQLWRRRGRSA
jgi:hypothetical protein